MAKFIAGWVCGYLSLVVATYLYGIYLDSNNPKWDYYGEGPGKDKESEILEKANKETIEGK